MKSMRIYVITLGLGLAAASAAWGAQSMMNLIASGEAVNKEADATRAAYEALIQKGKDVAAEGKTLKADQDKLKQDSVAYQADRATVQQSIADYQSRCGGSKQLSQEQYKACDADLKQINADGVRLNGEYPVLTERQSQTEAKVAAHNQAADGIDKKISDAYATWNAALKKQSAWLDQARSVISSDAFKPYAQKAGCPDTSKAAATPEAQMQTSDDVVACLKKVSNS